MDHWHFSILQSGMRQNFKLIIDVWILESSFMFWRVNTKFLGSDNFCPSECLFWDRVITRNGTAGSKIQVSIRRVWSWLKR